MQKDRAHAQGLLKELSSKYGKTVSQIMLRWAMQRGCAVIPGTGNPSELDLFHHSIVQLATHCSSILLLLCNARQNRSHEGESKYI